MRLTARVRAIERRTPVRGCRICRAWQASVLVCVPSEKGDDPDAWQRYLPYPETCPHYGRVVIQEVKVLVGVRWELL